MPSLCDVNVLVALAYRKHQSHPAAATWLATVAEANELVVCRQAQLGMLRLLNTRAVMGGDVLSVGQCWAIFEVLMSDERFTFRHEPRDVDARFRALMPPAQVSPKLWQDAYLAAFALGAGLSLVTFDAAFEQFKGLDLVLLN